MSDWSLWLSVLLLVPVLGGAVYSCLCLGAALVLVRRPRVAALERWPPVSILKPLHGLEKDLAANLRSACTLDYPDYQVVLSLQRLDDPALPLARAIAKEFGPERVTVAVEDSQPVVNGKIQNLVIGFKVACHDVIVISDSDVRLRPDYLKTIVAPLADQAVGGVCTLYRATRAETWFEQLELLTLNGDFTPNLVFAEVTGAADFCLGATTAVRRSVLEAIGGLGALADYLVEDYEMGRRIRAAGFKMAIVPYFVDMMVDLKRPADWWKHQVYWDQNTRAARPIGFLATALTRSVPFAALLALVRLFDPFSLAVLAAAVLVRVITSAIILRILVEDREGLHALWLLPFRDLSGLVSWGLALGKKTFIWRGIEFGLLPDGRIVPRAFGDQRALPLGTPPGA
ncbi:ceramide glucosyltransferase [uncultured Gammaproteobacteria bacterium]